MKRFAIVILLLMPLFLSGCQIADELSAKETQSESQVMTYVSSDPVSIAASDVATNTRSYQETYDAIENLFQTDLEQLDIPYPFDIGGVYEDDTSVVISIVKGYPNRYEDKLDPALAVRFEEVTFSYSELAVTLERIAPLMGDWTTSGIRVAENNIVFSYDQTRDTGLDHDALSDYLAEVQAGRITNELNLNVDELENYVSTGMLSHIRLEFQTPITLD